MPDPVIILGLGFAGQRLARRLRSRGVPVWAVVRDANRFREFTAMGVEIHAMESGIPPKAIPGDAVLVHSIPPLPDPEKNAIHSLVQEINPRRILYISSTGVYGAQTHVTEQTQAAPNDEKGLARIDEETWLTSAAPSTLILRSAAIYGPGRGIHMRLREGKRPRGAGGVVSRIHVDDLAAILEAGIDAAVEGAWPVADDCPAASEDVEAWCAQQMNLALPDEASPQFPVAGRSVDGGKIRELLQVNLKYPSYHSGIKASLIEEGCAPKA